MKSKGENLLAKQSKDWILEALIMLMYKKDYERITIKEISEKAGVDRKTFYRHFQSKNNVINYYLDQACYYYIEKLKAEPKLTTYHISKVYFETCLYHHNFLLLLDKHNLLPFMLIAYDKYLPEIHKIFEMQKTADSFLYHSEYALSFYTGGFWNISIKWIREKTPKSPDEMACIIEKLLTEPL